MPLRVLTWNLFHGRDFPPDPALRTLRSRLFRVTERNQTHAQVNRDLAAAFATVLATADWDVALLQECPPRWARPLAARCAADAHLVATSRNAAAAVRALAARLSPDLIAANEGGSNLILARRNAGGIAERRTLVVAPGPTPERRALAFIRLDAGICVANLHASAGARLRDRAVAELRVAAEVCSAWAADAPLVFGGDLNVRPRDGDIYGELERRFGLTGSTSTAALDHLLHTRLDAIEAPAAWPPERREVVRRDGLRIRLSDHAPVAGIFQHPSSASG